MNIIIPIYIGKKLDFKKLGEFSKKFPYFLSEIPKDSTDTLNIDLKQENSIKFKYKRVSAFANMNDILLEIDKLKQKYEHDTSFILKSLEKKFQKSIDELKLYLIEWEKKFSSIKTLKIASELKTGITITINDENILITGVTKLYHVPLIYNFFVTFLTLFINYEDYMRDKEFKKIFLSKNMLSDMKYYENNYEHNNGINNEDKVNLSQFYEGNYNLNNNYFIEDEIRNIKKVNEEYLNENMIMMMQVKQEIIGLARDDEIGSDVKLKCDDAIPEKDTCEDFCNDKMYFLRRLQRYDNKLFRPKFNKKNKSGSYPRQCLVKGQPVVMPYDPDNNPKIKRDSYTYSVKYSSEPELFNRWYICPSIWCPYCEIPISESDIDKKSIRVRSTKNTGGTCIVAKCPFGDHQVFVRSVDKKYIYPGFISKSDHPQKLCLPCCFINTHDNPKSAFYSTFKKCIGDDYQNKNIKEGTIYILGKGIPIDKDRYGRLTVEVARILKTSLDTGYLGDKSGYLRKGIQQENNNSFLSAICDILSCDKKNTRITVNKIKNILVDKLNEDLFRTLYGGNLQNVFFNPKSKLTPLENFKKYILNNEINLNHKYLWDLLQRDNILFENGINIFIFENNNLLCPKGENSKFFYNKNKKNMLLIKSKDYYEPIYYLKGDNKNTIETCIFEYNREEIKKIFEISQNGCENKFDIDWLAVLKDNIRKYDLNIDNLSTTNGYSIEKIIVEILNAINNKKLSKDYYPEWQYVDSYNKVFAITLNNDLYIPVSPSKIIPGMKYKIVKNIYDIKKIDFDKIIKYNKILNQICSIDSKITHKILDLKNRKNIIALVNQNNRVIPIKETVNNDKNIPISNLNYYSDLDEALENKIEKPDNRIDIINRKKFEDETFIRMKFELSKFLQNSKNKKYFDEILSIINSDEKSIKINREKLSIILDNIFSKILVIKNINIDYDYYKTPNKRVSCFLRNTKLNKKNSNSKNDITFSCENDPHCVLSNDSCKLAINKNNLLDLHKNINNYDYYTSKINDELLRFKIKRNEILNDNIPIIINKEIIQENPNKYIIVHTLNNEDIINIIEKLYLDNKGIIIDDRPLYENISTTEIAFKRDKYLKTNITNVIQNNSIEDLSVFWSKYFTSKYKVKIKDDNSIFGLFVYILNIESIKNLENNTININNIKNKIISYLKNNFNENKAIDLYKNNGNLNFKYISTFQQLLDQIISDTYFGSEVDLEFIAKIYNINIIIIDKRKKDNKGFVIYKSKTSVNQINKNDYFVILYRTIYISTNTYNIIQFKNKVLFKINELPQKFVQYVLPEYS